MEEGFPESIAAPGIHESWEVLTGRDPKVVQAAALVDYDPQTCTYHVPCLGQDIAVHVPDRTLSSTSNLGRMLLSHYPEYAKLSILRYMAHAQDRPLSGELVKPSQLPGGDFFVSGTHVLPLPALARRFDGHKAQFVRRGQVLGGKTTDHGDVSLELFPFPRIPVHIILWFGDEEFAAWATLLVDASCQQHMAVDILWSTCMLTLQMLRDENEY
ncbi:MAG: DUF3786 domain-containing protein [Desulfovermiculus sp.]|nr:DUF3786 domain-containing protein [Desulfovermiculus sp.]